MKKLTLFFFVMFLILPMTILAQEVTDTEIDVQAYLNAGALIFMTGIGGMAVMALVEIIKRVLKVTGIAVRIVSVIVAAGATLIYEMGKGFDTVEFIILTAVVALAANGIYLFPKKPNS